MITVFPQHTIRVHAPAPPCTSFDADTYDHRKDELLPLRISPCRPLDGYAYSHVCLVCEHSSPLYAMSLRAFNVAERERDGPKTSPKA